MKLRAKVINMEEGKEFAPGAIRVAARDIPVTVEFDHSRVVGRATLYIDGTADLEIQVPQEQRVGHADPDLGIGFVVEKERHEGALRIIERIRPVALSISADMLRRLEGK